MKAFIIYIDGHEASEQCANSCLKSVKDTESNLDVQLYKATTPETMFEVDWSWPLRKKKSCPHTHLLLKAYKTYDNEKRIAAAQSHWKLWNHCVTLDEPIMILEHDAIFKRQFVEPEVPYHVGAYSINDPRGATFKSKEYHEKLDDGFNEPPWLDEKAVPHGLPGHSAYVIYPWAAREVAQKQSELGWWPNDAIMCRQIFKWVYAYKPYFTTTQYIKSTTSK